MNRIYKVIWNEALSCFTAVGEYAKGRGNSSKSSVSSNATINTTSNLPTIHTLRLSTIALGLLAAGFGMPANAVGTYFAGDGSAPKIYTNPFLHQTVTVQGGETVTGDPNTKNISVTANRRDKSLTVKLDKDVDLGADGSLKTGDTLVDNSGIKITAVNPANSVTLSSSGLNNGNNKIFNVADGDVMVGSKEAVNGSQLYSLASTVAANKTKYYSVNTMAIGNANNDGATGDNAMAMGGNASALGSQTIAIGSGESGQHTTALGEQSIAIGANVVSRGGSSIAIGGDDLNAASEANLDGTSNIGKNTGTVNTVFKSYTGRDLVEPAYYARNTEATGAASIAIGSKSLSTGDLSTAVGVQASTEGVAASAFGMGSSATKKGSVALGAGSTTLTDATYQDKLTIGNKDYLYAGATNDKGAQISVGSERRERQIKHVASGEVSAASTDAINGSQLHATNESVKDLSTTVVANKTHFYSVNSTDSTRGNYHNDGATGVDAMAAGIDAQAVGNRAVAMGTGASATSSESTALGAASQAFAGSATAVGFGARADKYGTTAVGVNSRAQGEYSTAVGQQAEAIGDDSIAMARGAKATKKSAIAVGVNAKADGERSVAVGEGAKATTLTGTAIGSRTLASAVQSTAVGVGSKATKQWATSIGFSSQANGVSSVALGDRSEVSGKESIAIGKGNMVSGTNSIAIGTGHTIIGDNSGAFGDPNNITGSGSYVIGNNNNVANNNTFVLGNGVETTQDNSVVLGNLSTDRAATMETGVTISGTPYNYAGSAPVGVTSVGFVGGERQVINVAAGAVNATSTDAINGSQLYATNEAIESNTTTINKGFALKAADGNTVQKPLGQAVEVVGSNDNIDTIVKNGKIEVKLNNDLNLGNNGSISTGNIFGGTQVNRLGIVTGGLLMGGVTTVSGVGVTVTGTHPLSNATLSSDGLSMAGGPSITKSGGIDAGNKKIVNVNDGENPNDAVNVSQLNSSSAAARTKVIKGTNVSSVEFSTDSITGQDIYTVNADGVTASAGSTAVIVTAGGKDETTNMTDYAVDLSADSKASLVKADSAMQTIVAQIDGVDVKTLNQTDNTANFLTGDNIVLSAEDGGIKIATKEDVTFTSVTTGDTSMNTSGISFLGGSTVSLSSNGLNNGGNQITGVASGVGNDLNAANIGDVNRASAAAKTEVTAGTNVADVVKSTGSNGQDVYTVNADGVTASAGSAAVTVTAGEKDETTNTTDYAVDLSADSKASLVKADSAMQTIIAQIDGVDVKTLNQTDNTANFLTGDNIVLSAEDGGIKIATKEDVTFTSASFANSTVRVSSEGLDNGGNKIINVDDGEADTDAVNVRQLNATNNTVDLGLNFTGDDTNVVINRKLGQTLTLQGGATNVTENNIGVIADEEGNLNVRLAEDVMLGKNGSVRMESTVFNNAGVTITDGPNQTITLSNEGLDNGNNRIIKVGEGVAPTDAVNFAQLTMTNDEIAKGIKIGDGNSANDQQFALGDTINVTGDSNLTTVASATGVQVKLNNQLDLGGDGSIQIGNSIMNNTGFTFIDSGQGRTVTLSSRGLDNGGNTIRNVGEGVLNTDAVNVGQLKDVAIALDQGWGITAQGDIATMVKQGDAVDLSSKDGNIKVSRKSVSDVAALNGSSSLQAAAIPTNANDISFDLNPDITLNSVTTGDTVMNDNGLTIANGPSITKNGIDAANTKITNIQDGEVSATSQDAINGGQLYAQGAGISSIIGGDTVYNAENGTFTNSDIGGTGESNIDGAIASIRQGTIEISENVQINTESITTNTTNIATNTTNIATNNSNITTNTTNIKTNTDKLEAGLNFGADSGANINKPIGDGSVLSFTGGNNITTTADGSSIKFDLNGNINVDSVTVGTTVINSEGISMQDGPSMTSQGLYAGNQRMTGVADGVEATDAVNYSQLSALDSRLNNNMSDLGYKIDEVEDDANAGISAAMAMSAMPQAYIAGKSLIGGGVGTYNGESAVAIGFSKLSNDGRWVIKVNGSADTQGNVGGAVGAGFHFD